NDKQNSGGLFPILPFTVQTIDEGEEIAQFLGGQPLDAHEIQEERLKRAAVHLVDQSFELPANDIITGSGRVKEIHPFHALALDEFFCFQTFQELVDSSVFGGPAFGIEDVRELSDAGGSLI